MPQLGFTQCDDLQIEQGKPGARYFAVGGNQCATVIGCSPGMTEGLVATRALQQADGRTRLQAQGGFNGLQCFFVKVLPIKLDTEFQPFAGTVSAARRLQQTPLRGRRVDVMGLCRAEQVPEVEIVGTLFSRAAQDLDCPRPGTILKMPHALPEQYLWMIGHLLRDLLQQMPRQQAVAGRLQSQELPHEDGLRRRQTPQSLTNLGGYRLAARPFQTFGFHAASVTNRVGSAASASKMDRPNEPERTVGVPVSNRVRLTAGLLALAMQAPSLAQPPAPQAKPGTMQRVLDDSKAADWRALDPDNTLYVELAAGRVIIELAPAFAPSHVANIRELARGKYWDGLAILRSHDNYVVQWGDPESGTPKARGLGKARKQLPAEFARDAEGVALRALPDADGWAPETGFAQGFAVARDRKEGKAWLTHCYGSVGAGRDNAADSSNGTELYVVIGQSPRHLDRNITLVGRVISGMEILAAIPRGTGALGFFEKPGQRVAIRSIRLLADVPAGERSTLEVLRTDTATWDALVESRRNRRDDWYLRPAGHINLCNVPLPVRAPPAPVAAKPNQA